MPDYLITYETREPGVCLGDESTCPQHAWRRVPRPVPVHNVRNEDEAVAQFRRVFRECFGSTLIAQITEINQRETLIGSVRTG